MTIGPIRTSLTELREEMRDVAAGQWHRPLRGNLENPSIVVVCEPPTNDAIKAGLPMAAASFRLLADVAFAHGLVREDFLFVGLCPPMPKNILKSDSKRWAHVEPHIEPIWEKIRDLNPKAIVPLGKEAARVVSGRPVAITKARGRAYRNDDYAVLPMLSPAMVLRVPEHHPTFVTDVQTLARLKTDNYAIVDTSTEDIDYQWCEDLSALIAMHPDVLAVDTETTGLRWYDPNVEIITVQLTYAPGQALVIPVDPVYWPEWNDRPRALRRLLNQLKFVLEDPTIRKIGHNLKFDVHMLRKLGIELANWADDTQLKAFAVDENMMEKSLDECVRRWVPAMAGYADHFNATVDKANMRAVPRDDFLLYAGGDTDSTFRLNAALDDLMERDPAQKRVYQLVQMPAMRAFANTIERFGMRIDTDRLEEFGTEVRDWLRDAYPKLIRRVPAQVRRNHLEAGKELAFSRPDFTRDVLFSPAGFNLTPVVFTPGTRDEDDPNLRIASTSAKEHLPFFADPATTVGQFVVDLIDFQKTSKLESNFIGEREHGNGMWQYLSPCNEIFPSYMLHRVVTGRTSSAEPNGQNFPKRGRWAKLYQSIFIPRPGFKLVNCDLSQVELRIAAWMANERTMLRIYRENGDIHTATAKYVRGLTDGQWAALSPRQRKDLRTKAKAVNFGFLYGMGARKFRSFAKTDYGVEYTERESYEARDAFFRLYPGLEIWHAETREFVRANGYVRALHGAVRHLPSIWSNDTGIQAEAERQAINSPVQRFGSDLGLIAMARFSAQADPDLFRIIGFVHDALVMEVRDGYEQEGIEALLWAMQSTPLREWFGLNAPLPILAEADIGLNGGNMIEFADLPDDRPEWFENLGFSTVTATKPAWWDDAVEEENVRLFLTN